MGEKGRAPRERLGPSRRATEQKKTPPAFTRAFLDAAEPPRRRLRGTKDVETALFLSPVVRAPPADRPEVLSVLLLLSCAIFFVRLLLNLLYVCVQYILPILACPVIYPPPRGPRPPAPSWVPR